MMESLCCVCHLQATPAWNAVCVQCGQLCHFGEACSSTLSGGRTICLKCAVDVATAGLGLSAPSVPTAVPQVTTTHVHAVDAGAFRGILREPTTTFTQLPSPTSVGPLTQFGYHGSVNSIIAGAARSTKSVVPKRAPHQLPNLLKVQDPCNDRQNPRLPIASRIKCLQRLHRMLITNDPQLDTILEEEVPIAAHCEHAVFKRHVHPGGYIRQFTTLFKEIEAATVAAMTYNIQEFMKGGGRASVAGSTSKRRRVDASTPRASASTTASATFRALGVPNTSSAAASAPQLVMAQAPTPVPSSAPDTASTPVMASPDPELAFLDVECGCRVAIVDTAEKLETALDLLAVSGAAIAVDIEGANLGAAGKISTIQLCVEGSSDVFICDILALGPPAFATNRVSLRGLLESDKLIKLFWDCRTDSVALYHQFGVRPRKVLDLQVMHVALLVAANQRPEYLTGLGKVLDELCPIPLAERTRLKVVKQMAHALFAPNRGGSLDAWLQRPIKPLLLEYATDVRYFHALRSSLNRCRNGKCAGVEVLFKGVLEVVCERRVSDSCRVAVVQNPSRDGSGAKIEAHVLKCLCEYSEQCPDGPRVTAVMAAPAALLVNAASPQKNDSVALKIKIAGVVKRLLQRHYNDRKLTKDQFKSGAKKLTTELLRSEHESDAATLEKHAESRVRCYVADVNPLNVR